MRQFTRLFYALALILQAEEAQKRAQKLVGFVANLLSSKRKQSVMGLVLIGFGIQPSFNGW